MVVIMGIASEDSVREGRRERALAASLALVCLSAYLLVDSALKFTSLEQRRSARWPCPRGWSR
jgi:hypothetical protein